MLRDKLNGMIEVSRLEDEKSGELFLRFCIGAVGRRDCAVCPVQGHGGLRRLKRYFGSHMSVDAETVVILKAFVEHCVSLVLGHPFECSWRQVSQADVFHPFPLCAVTQRAMAHRSVIRWSFGRPKTDSRSAFYFICRIRSWRNRRSGSCW